MKASEALKWQLLGAVGVVTSLMFIRLSICLFFLPIFGTPRAWRWTLYTVMAFITAANLSSAVTILAQCRPLRKVWNPLVPGTCFTVDTTVAVVYYNGCKSCLCTRVSCWILGLDTQSRLSDL